MADAPKSFAAGRALDALGARRLRARFFDAALFREPAWDILLDLFANDCAGRAVAVGEARAAAAIPGTTAIRWVRRLVDAGLVEIEADPDDRRRSFMRTTPAARIALAAYFAQLEPLEPGVTPRHAGEDLQIVAAAQALCGMVCARFAL